MTATILSTKHAVTLQASNQTDMTEFRGLLVQLRSAADQSILGDQLAEIGDDPDIQYHACEPASGGFTHTNNTDKTDITFQWTPRAGAGTVVFRYVIRFNTAAATTK